MMADEKKVLRLLKTARGQMDGIIKICLLYTSDAADEL